MQPFFKVLVTAGLLLLALIIVYYSHIPLIDSITNDMKKERAVRVKNRLRLNEAKKAYFTVPDNPVCSEIDAVYLWVNGSDPLVAEQYYDVFHKRIPLDNRLRDIPLLKYSIRALFTYAPFIRQLIIVTNGQKPYWLNESSPRVRIVTHEEIFQHKENLPTFNSNAIESQLGNIPGIAPCWFYFNDDFSFGRVVDLRDWMNLQTGTQKLAYWAIAAPFISHMMNKSWDMSVGYSNLLLNKMYYPNDVSPDTDMFNVRHSHDYEAHNVRFIQQKNYRAMYARFRDAFEKTSTHRLREVEDTVSAFLYNHFVEKEELGYASPELSNNMLYRNFLGEPKKDVKTVSFLLQKKPISWCLNDKAPSHPTNFQIAQIDSAIDSVVALLEYELPFPSEVENHGPEPTIPRTLDGFRVLLSRVPREQPDYLFFFAAFFLIGLFYIMAYSLWSAKTIGLP